MQAYFDESGVPRVSIIVGGFRSEVAVEALLDTGFDGQVCLPIRLALQLGLDLIATQEVEYADGRVETELLFSGTVRVNAEPQEVEIGLTESDEALIGREMFEGLILTLDFSNWQINIEEPVGKAP